MIIPETAGGRKGLYVPSHSTATHISPLALWRHLKNLASRQLAVRSDAGWRLSPKPSRLARAFLALLKREAS